LGVQALDARGAGDDAIAGAGDNFEEQPRMESGRGESTVAASFPVTRLTVVRLPGWVRQNVAEWLSLDI